MDALVTLPGVGRKTANVVLGHALGVPGLPVDRHVLRVAGRLGLIHTDDAVKAEAQLTALLPPERWTRASDTLILHGRRICRPTPQCPICHARTLCPYAITGTAVRTVRRDAGQGAADRRPRASGRAAAPGAPPPHAAGATAIMTRDRFRALVAEAIDSIPPRFAAHVRNLAVVIEDDPSAELLAEMEIEPPDTLLGLYQGTPLTERRWDHGNALPDHVLLFQRPIEEDAEDRRRRRRRDRRDADPRARPLFRAQRGRDHGHRGALLARRARARRRRRRRRDARPQALRPALPRAGLAGEGADGLRRRPG